MPSAVDLYDFIVYGHYNTHENLSHTNVPTNNYLIRAYDVDTRYNNYHARHYL